MKSMIYDSVRSIQQLLDSAFEMPIHFAAVGTNGAVVAGTYWPATHGRSFQCQITVQTTKPEGSASPCALGVTPTGSRASSSSSKSAHVAER